MRRTGHAGELGFVKSYVQHLIPFHVAFLASDSASTFAGDPSSSAMLAQAQALALRRTVKQRQFIDLSQE
jgi:hypothetical protein